MPLVAHTGLPSFERLRQEGYTVLPAAEGKGADPLELHIGLLNLMPDAALEATERQFMRLLAGSGSSAKVYVYVFTVDAMPRLGRAREYVNTYYTDFQTLTDTGLDALVLTGANPASSELASEPFWHGLVEVIEWGTDNVCSILCSCLATHAVVQQYHQVERIKLPQKRWGVYSHRLLEREHPLTRHLNTRFDAPHSHVYEVTRAQLESVGLSVLAESEQAGVHLAVSEDQFQFICFQGHPEYDFNSLFKEYKREINRFVTGERDDYPPFPENYFSEEAASVLNDYRERLVSANDQRAIFGEFPELVIERLLDNTWTDTGNALFVKWLELVLASKNGVAWSG